MIYAHAKPSEKSLDDMFFNVEQWLVSSILEGFAEGEEKAIVNGNGTKKPTGFLNGTPDIKDDKTRDFGKLQYFATGTAADWGASDSMDIFLKTIYELKTGYRSNARWLMSRSTTGEIMRFKDKDGRYLWQPSLVLGQPNRFLNFPIFESDEMPDKGAGKFPVAFGDFRAGYVLCDLVGFRLTKGAIPPWLREMVCKTVSGWLCQEIRSRQAD